jgi:copper homeostasis protein
MESHFHNRPPLQAGDFGLIGRENQRSSTQAASKTSVKGSQSTIIMTSLFFELCAESVEAACAAESGGADRIELCSRLSEGGTTPSVKLMIASVKAVSIPVYVLIRPRAGDFNFNSREYDLMRRQIDEAKAAGASGVALGVLHTDGTVDVERTRTLVEYALPLATTFHRAFDETPDLTEALEQVIETGASGLLTSGGAAEVMQGADCIARLQRQADGRIHIIAGGGLRLASLVELVRRSGAFSLHGSLTNSNGSNGHKAGATQLEANIREAVRLLRSEYEQMAAQVQER